MFKILLVENNINYRRVLRSALLSKFSDIEVKEASDEVSARGTVETFMPNLVFMDVSLNGDINGLEATRKIKAMAPQTTIAMLSQYDLSEYRVVAEQNGADNYFPKSVSLERLFEYVTNVKEVKQPRTEKRLSACI